MAGHRRDTGHGLTLRLRISAQILLPQPAKPRVSEPQALQAADRVISQVKCELSGQHVLAFWCRRPAQLSPRAGHPRPTSANSPLSTHGLLGVLPPYN